MTTGFANSHFIGNAFLTITPSTALIVVGILFMSNKGESTVFLRAAFPLQQWPPTFFAPWTCFI